MSCFTSPFVLGIAGLTAIAAEVGALFSTDASNKNAELSGLCCKGDSMSKLIWPCSSGNTTLAERSHFCSTLTDVMWIAMMLNGLAPLLFWGVAEGVSRKYIDFHESREGSELIPKASSVSSGLKRKIVDMCTSTPARVVYKVAACAAPLVSLFLGAGASLAAETLGACAGTCVTELSLYVGLNIAYKITTIAAPLAALALVGSNIYNRIKQQQPSVIPNPAPDTF